MGGPFGGSAPRSLGHRPQLITLRAPAHAAVRGNCSTYPQAAPPLSRTLTPFYRRLRFRELDLLASPGRTFLRRGKNLSGYLSTKPGHPQIEAIWKRIGRLKAQSSGAGQHYHIEVDADEAGKNATAIRWEQRPVAGSKLTHPGVYCLRSNQTDWSAETMWRTYLMLTDLEAVFRSLKSELGLRPIFHQRQHRSNGHLFITVLAYQLVQVIRRRLREQGEHSSWDTLRSILGGQQRVTCSFLRDDGSTLHVRKATRAEPDQGAIYDALGVDPAPGGIKKLVAA